MKSKIFFLSIIVSFITYSQKAIACGYYEFEWEYRPMTFQAQLPGMVSLYPFIYTTESAYYILNSDPMGNDRKRNIEEWQREIQEKINPDDIYQIQYKTEPESFVHSFETNALKEYLTNPFIKILATEKKYKDILDYLVFAKKAEASETDPDNNYFEQWGDNADKSENYKLKKKLLEEAEEKLEKVKSSFLKDRYAFQLVRLSWQTGQYQKASDAYDIFFKDINPNSLMNNWAGLFKAMSLDRLNRKQEANRFYIHVFDNSDEKKLRSVQLFNRNLPVPENFTNREKSLVYVINSINFPGRALDRMEKIFELDKKNKYLPFLAMREINKLEDWMISSVYLKSEQDPLYCSYEYNPDNMKEDDPYYVKKKNLETDMEYLKKFKAFLNQLYENTVLQEQKDYYSLALAHLSLLEENSQECKLYLSRISSNAGLSIQIQKQLEELWISIKTDNILSDTFKQKYITGLKDLLKKIADYNNSVNKPGEENKISYTFALSLAEEYKKRGDIVTYCLLKNISNIKKDSFGGGLSCTSVYSSDFYGSIRQFDFYASVSDMDRLIAFVRKNNKTDFEKYLAEQPLMTIDAYKDLKGTIAFRNKDLKTAFETFASMDQDYWDSNYDYKNYLNEDPFIPKGLYNDNRRDFSYKFNKTDFVKTLLNLEKIAIGKNKQKAADAYLKLGHAFFNTSIFGNAWMMTSYGWSNNYTYYYKNIDCLTPWIRDYITASIATVYYEKALSVAVENEQKAYATLMLNRTHWHNVMFTGNKKEKELAAKYAIEYFENYAGKTAFDKQNECKGYEAYLE